MGLAADEVTRSLDRVAQYGGAPIVRGDLLRQLRRNRAYPAGLLGYFAFARARWKNNTSNPAALYLGWAGYIRAIEQGRGHIHWPAIWRIAKALAVAPDDFLRYPLAHGRGNVNPRLYL